MIQLRRSNERGHANHGWLDTHHTFSFAGYYDPRYLGFRALRVINDDRVIGGRGFGTHGHRDMEILSYVVEGALEHRDSTGTGSVIRPGDVQRMSAGRGVHHSEYNHDDAESVRFLQIWIEPSERGLEPSYEQKHFGDERRNALRLVASPDGARGSLTVHQDVRVYASVLEAGASVAHRLGEGRHAWVQVVRGAVRLHTGADEETLRLGDGAAISEVDGLRLEADEDSELLLFDLA